MNFKNMMLSERSQTQTTYVQFNLYEMTRIDKSIDTESRLVVAKNYDNGEIGRYC